MKNKTLLTVVACATLAVTVPSPGTASTRPCASAAKAAKSTAARALSKSVPAGWGEDLEKARANAKKNGKKILVAFSGSDWCGWCVKMDRDVYSKPAFVAAAGKTYELVLIDLPQDTSILSETARKNNRALAAKYGVRGFPSTMVLDADGKVLKKISGYKSSPEALLKALAE